MRAFILCALLAMATTVSCQSATCNTAYTALETNANVTTARAFVSETGCQELNFNDTQCTQPTTDVYSCACINTFENTTAWEAAVTQNDGRACYLKFDFTLIGSLAVDNVTTRVVQLTANQTNVEFLSIPNNCTDDDLKAKAGSFVTQAVNKLTTTAASFQKTNVTWTSGSVTISACTTTVTESRTFGGATTAPTTAAPTVPGTTTQPPTGSSSTGKSGASIIASSAALVASLIAAVTILA